MTTFTIENKTFKTNGKNYFGVVIDGKTKTISREEFEKAQAEFDALQPSEPEAPKTAKAPKAPKAKKSKAKDDKPVTEVTFPKLTAKNNDGLKKYLDELGACENMEVKTWEKIAGRHAIAAYGKNIALVTINRNDKFAVHLNGKMLEGVLPGSNVIKNGALSVYITKCNNVEAIVNLLQNLIRARYVYAKDRTDSKVNVVNVKLKDEK